MNKEKLCLIIIGGICILSCAFLSIFNVIEANYSYVEIIPQKEYNEGISLVSQDEEIGDASETGTININTASAGQLAEFLPGIGEKKAALIVEYRELTGGFAAVDELINVDGIGEKTLENIRPYCRVSD